MKTSICIATYNKPNHLQKVLQSIYSFNSGNTELQVIVVDDGSPTNQWEVCKQFVIHQNPTLHFVRIHREDGYRNPSVARNVAYRLSQEDRIVAQSSAIVAQSDDVIHTSPIEKLTGLLTPGHFVIAKVINTDEEGRPTCNSDGQGFGDSLVVYTSPDRPRPLFFLGALYTEDLYAVGGNDEEFVDPSGEDRWFALCLMRGRGLKPIYTDQVIGHHLQHLHTRDYDGVARSQALLQDKTDKANRGVIPWTSASGPWE